MASNHKVNNTKFDSAPDGPRLGLHMMRHLSCFEMSLRYISAESLHIDDLIVFGPQRMYLFVVVKQNNLLEMIIESKELEMGLFVSESFLKAVLSQWLF